MNQHIYDTDYIKNSLLGRHTHGHPIGTDISTPKTVSTSVGHREQEYIRIIKFLISEIERLK